MGYRQAASSWQRWTAKDSENIDTWLQRVDRVEKSAWAASGNRPTVADHYRTIAVSGSPSLGLGRGRRMTVVDDVVTTGATLYGTRASSASRQSTRGPRSAPSPWCARAVIWLRWKRCWIRSVTARSPSNRPGTRGGSRDPDGFRRGLHSGRGLGGLPFEWWMDGLLGQ